MSLRSKANRIEKQILRLDDEHERQRLMDTIDQILQQMIDDVQSYIAQKTGEHDQETH